MVKKRIFLLILSISFLLLPVQAAEDYIRWVDFDVDYEVLRVAMELDIQSQETEQPLSWIDILALSATRCGGGKLSISSVKKAAKDLCGNLSVEELLGRQFQYYTYYHEAYTAVLGGLLGSYAIEVNGEWVPTYGLKAFSPIAAGYGYEHYPDFGGQRTYGFKRKHLGNDLMGALGTPIVAVEGGIIEAMGWNQYGGWRIGIRSKDRKRYYYYAHLQKDHPFPNDLREGMTVQAGDVIGFMGRTGYSTKENSNNIDIVHLHFGIQLIFHESQKECNSEIWINPYNLIRLLSTHRSTIAKTNNTWSRLYPYRDLDEP